MATAADSSVTKSQFKRVLTRWDLIVYGLAMLTPTAAFPVYGIIQNRSLGHAVLSYLVVMVPMLFTAASYGKMAGAYPVAGSTYTYAQRALNPHIGFLAGWAMILDYFLIPLLSVIYCADVGVRLFPVVPYAGWVVLITAGITFVNVRGIRVTARASGLMTYIMCICAILFAACAAVKVVKMGGAPALIFPQAFYNPGTFALNPLMLGAAIAALSYIGFDAISTMAEDTIHPEKDISFATVVVCLVQTVFCVGTVYLATLVWADYRTLPVNAETAILDISGRAGGPLLFGVITFALVVAGLASALTGQAGASRLLFGMGRDGVISRRIFAHLDARYATPTRSIYLMAGVSLVGSFMTFELATQLVNFGAFVGFILVNLSVIRHYYIRLHRRKGWDFVRYFLFPLMGALVCGYIWISLTPIAKLVGFAWLGLGVVYLAVLTKGFREAPQSLGTLTEGTADAN